MFGFDCINVKTTANLTGFVPEFWSLHDEDRVARLTPAPTANTTGVIQLYHKIESCGANVYYPMPSIGDGYANNTYTRDDNVSNNTFDYYFPNKEVGIQIGTVNKGPFKLTIDSPYVKVNAGGNSLDIIATEGIDESLITITPPYGKKVVGWYNADNKNEYVRYKEVLVDYDTCVNGSTTTKHDKGSCVSGTESYWLCDGSTRCASEPTAISGYTCGSNFVTTGITTTQHMWKKVWDGDHCRNVVTSASVYPDVNLSKHCGKRKFVLSYDKVNGCCNKCNGYR